ncbi:hypothetical protein LJK88_24990 [Paenibacillus sp. P26]|nr:hypothetical protein LJK88_24990 [Paenibacillus sp. P26]UUZ95292.1 hypothetical protein LJK87_12945 [Paenibacillus sp. P25]
MNAEQARWFGKCQPHAVYEKWVEAAEALDRLSDVEEQNRVDPSFIAAILLLQ